MNHLIDIAGITTLGSVAAIATITLSALNPIGAGLIIAGAILWSKKNF